MELLGGKSNRSAVDRRLVKYVLALENVRDLEVFLDESAYSENP